jgi:hypothetical protein
MKQYMRIVCAGIMTVAIMLGVPFSLHAATVTTKKTVAGKTSITKKTSSVKKKTTAKKVTKKKKTKKKKEILNLNPPLIDPNNPPGGK